MIKRIFHLFLAFIFPFFVFSKLLQVVFFYDESLGESWIPDSHEMLENCKK